MRSCVRGARICRRTLSRYLLKRSRVYSEVPSFAGNRVWAPGDRVLWYAVGGSMGCRVRMLGCA